MFHDNLVVVRTYDGQACINAGDFVPGHEVRIFNNTCILPPRGSSGNDPDTVLHTDQACFGPKPGNLISYQNNYHTLHNNATATCGDGSLKRIIDIPPPFEEGSTSNFLPDGPTIMLWAKEILGM